MEFHKLIAICMILLSAETGAVSLVTTGLRCRQCSGVTDPHFCSMVAHCLHDEECYTEQVIGEDATVFYNLGCRKQQLCQLAFNGKRADLLVCDKCCAAEFCNGNLCPVTNSTVPGIQCYQCDLVNSPQDCNNRIVCGSGEQCIVQKFADENMQIKYSLSCETKQRCDLLHQLTGKRSTQICNQCCDTAGCNKHLCIESHNSTTVQPNIVTSTAVQPNTVTSTAVQPNTVTSNSSGHCTDQPDIDCKLADDTHGICAQRTLAAEKYCQKYCGYCTASGHTGTTRRPPTGTTTETCIDSGDIDCQQMNASLHLCAKKDSPPALLYCPKFCKLCTTHTPPCLDNPDVDCNLANQTGNICALRSLAATKYCPNFCGYCSPDGSTRSTLPPPTGITEDPCKDSGNVNCKEMNDTINICAKKDAPPTMLYCPKFCGLCKPSCADFPEVDCKLANTTDNICALGTLAAKKYCKKFCGYCSVDGQSHFTVIPPTGTTQNTCIDKAGVNCQGMDQMMQICAKKDSPPTIFYCPKYCGLCT